MSTTTRKLVTLITEASIEQLLVADLLRLGAKGYTVTDARGQGSRGVRNAGWGATSNVRIEVICTQEVAQALTAHVRQHYYQNYAMVLYVADVEVLRPEKF